MRRYCNVVSATRETTAAGDELWVLTHACGKVEKRIARRVGKKRTYAAPKKVGCPTGSPAMSDAVFEAVWNDLADLHEERNLGGFS